MPSQKNLQSILQALMADRFPVRVHRQMKDLPVYAPADLTGGIESIGLKLERRREPVEIIVVDAAGRHSAN